MFNGADSRPERPQDWGLVLNYYFLVIQAVFLFFRFFRIKGIYPVCLPILSQFLAHWRCSPPILPIFTGFLFWPAESVKKAPSGMQKSLGAPNVIFFAQKWLRFSSPFPKMSSMLLVSFQYLILVYLELSQTNSIHITYI